MQLLISRCLIIFLLLSNVAWAVDMHAEAFFGHDEGWSQDSGSHPDTEGGPDACDHCCHGTAHLTCLRLSEAVMIHEGTGRRAARAVDLRRSLILSPPTHPPRA